MTPHRSALGTVATVTTGRTPKGLDQYLASQPRDDRTVPFYKVGDLNLHPRRLMEARTTLALEEMGTLGLATVPVGSVVFPKVGGAIATNKKRQVARAGAIDLNCMAVTPGPALDSDYLFHWFQRLDLRALSDGSILPQIGKSRVAALAIQVPPHAEQRRIVAVLEEHLSDLEDAARSLTSARERSEVLWISALRRARETARKHGPLSSIGQLADTSLGKMLDAKRQVGELMPYLRNINVRWGRFDLDDLQTTALTDADRDRLVLKEGDLLVCEGGEPGRCAVWSQPESGIAFQKALHRVRIAEPGRMTPEFLAAMIEEGIRIGRWERFFTGTTIKHLPQQQLRRLEVPVPPLQLQESLVAKLSEQRAALDRLREQVAMAERRGQSLRQAVLAAAFSGRLTGHGVEVDVMEQAAVDTKEVS